MDLPIPTHLQPFLTIIGEENNEYVVTGTIHCSCNHEHFELWESNDRNIVKLICKQCGKTFTGTRSFCSETCSRKYYNTGGNPFRKKEFLLSKLPN